jgi:hypothetical protein
MIIYNCTSDRSTAVRRRASADFADVIAKADYLSSLGVNWSNFCVHGIPGRQQLGL